MRRSVVLVLNLLLLALPLGAVGQEGTRVTRQVMVDVVFEMPQKLAEPEFPWLGVDPDVYSEYLLGSADGIPNIVLAGVSYQYVPLSEPAEWAELRSELQSLEQFSATEFGPPDLPAEALPPDAGEPANGVWIVAGLLSQPVTPELCENHQWRFNVTVSNPGRVPFSANENRPGSMFDGGDVFYGSDIECDRVSMFADATNETGQAGAWIGWHVTGYDGGFVVYSLIPDMLLRPDAQVRVSLQERPPRGVQGDSDTDLFTTDAPVGQPLVLASGFDQWPMCAAELGIVGEAPPGSTTTSTETPTETTTAGATSPTVSGEEIDATDEEGAFWVLVGVGGIAFFALVAITYWRWKRGQTDEEPLGYPSQESSGIMGVLKDDDDPRSAESGGGVARVPTTEEVERVAGEILDLDSVPTGSVDEMVSAVGESVEAAYEDLLEALGFLGLVSFGDQIEKGDEALEGLAESAEKVPPEPGDPCAFWRQACQKAKTELERRKQLRDQKEAAARRARADQAELEKALGALDEFLDGLGDSSIEAEGETVDEVDLRLHEKYVDQRRAAFQAAMAAAGTQADRTAASQRFEQEMRDSRTPEARDRRRQETGDIRNLRDRTSEDLEAARKRTERAELEKGLADQAVANTQRLHDHACAKAAECENEHSPEAVRATDEELREKVRRANEELDAQHEKREQEWEEEERRAREERRRKNEEAEKAKSRPPAPGEKPPIPGYLASKEFCAEDSTKTVPVAVSDKMNFIDPDEEMTITFKNVKTPELEEWLKQTNPDAFGGGFAGEEQKGSVPAQAFLDLTGPDLDGLLNTELKQGSESYRGIGQLEIMVELRVYEGHFNCSEVWKCVPVPGGNYAYEFDGYRCALIQGTQTGPTVRTRTFGIDQLMRLEPLLTDVQSWISGFVGEQQKFCRDCHGGTTYRRTRRF